MFMNGYGCLSFKANHLNIYEHILKVQNIISVYDGHGACLRIILGNGW